MVKSNAERRIVSAAAKGAAKGARRAAARSNAGARSTGIVNRTRGSMRALDAPAQAWLRLLNDPCYGRLTHPIYPGADGGYLSRFESEQTSFAGPGITAGVISFIPGTLPNSVFANGAVDDTTSVSLNDSSAAQAPGYAYLRGVASAVRCVSACVQVSWPGSELNRQGFVTLGQVTGAVAATATTGFGTGTVSVSALRPLCHLRTRVPETVAEVKWRPTLADAQWHDPNVTAAVGRLNEAGAILLTASNLPASTGLRVRYIVTYEWVPKSAQGLTSSFDNRARSVNSTDDVINMLDRQGPDWAYMVGRATSVLGMMSSAYVAGRTARLMG